MKLEPAVMFKVAEYVPVFDEPSQALSGIETFTGAADG
jgi:hypothetical protein